MHGWPLLDKIMQALHFTASQQKYQFACSLSQVKVLGSVPGRACDWNNVFFTMRNLYAKGPRDLPVVFYAPVAPGCDWIGRLASGDRDVLVPSNALEVLWGAIAACWRDWRRFEAVGC